MNDYFDKLKKTLEENNLMKNPAQIYNVDETGMPLDHHPPKVVAIKGQKKVRSRTSGNKSQVTVIACVSATGHTLPPFVIFDAKSLNMEWTRGEVAGTRYGLSSTGWVDTDLFKGWLVEHFLNFAVGGRPLMLILDGHSTHYQPELIKYAMKHKIILFCLPPHTTHESQPLDASVFKPLKSHWHEACHSFVEKNPGKSITKYNFSKLLNTAWAKTMSPSIISSGFRRSGIYPFNPDAIDYGMAADVASDTGKDKDKQATEVSHNNEELCSSEQCGNEEETPVRPSEQQFTPEQEELFNRRYEENYDIPDPIYLEWLKINHPESHPETPVCPSEQRFTPEQEELFNRRYEENYDIPDPIYLEWLKINHPESHPETPVCPSEQRFTPEQEELFNRRYEENYDIPDPIYLEWLMINHAESHPDNSSLSDHFPFVAVSDDLLLQELDSYPLAEDSSLCLVNSGANIVPHAVSPLTEEVIPVREDEHMEMNSQAPPATDSCPRSSSEVNEHGSGCVEKVNSKEVSTTKDDACPGPSRVLSSTISAVQNIPPPEHEGELNYISKYLVQYIPAKKAPPTGQRATTGARVLTSEECAQLIFEREEKKKKLHEEKEARKAERELKKREREEAAKKKAEQTAKRKEEAAKKKEEAAKRKEEIARKKEDAARKKLEKATRSTTKQVARRVNNNTLSSAAKRRRVDSEEHELDNDTDPLDDEMQETSSDDHQVHPVASRDRAAKRPSMETEGSSSHLFDDNNVCCVCFRTYEEDLEEETGFLWVKCVCQRWIHEDCYSEVVMDKHGRELICPYCVV